MSKWISVGGAWITEKGGISISLDKDKLPPAVEGKFRLLAFKNEKKEGKQPDYRVCYKGEDETNF